MITKIELATRIDKINEEINNLKWYQKIPFGFWRIHLIKGKNCNFISLSNYKFSIPMSILGIILSLFFKVPWAFTLLFSLQLIEDLGFDIISYFFNKKEKRK
jgi:hypothetical protein